LFWGWRWWNLCEAKKAQHEWLSRTTAEPHASVVAM